jgi:two-component system sensor histidine kinase TorS
VAREHGEARVRLGFDVVELVDEFVILRQVLIDVLLEDEAPLDARAVLAVADAIAGAFTAAVKTYVESRDYDARMKEAEHIGFVTHDLRSPLATALLGVSRILRSRGLSAEHARSLEVVERSLRRLADLVDGVLLVAKGEHTLCSRPSVVTLRQIVEEPVASARFEAEAKGLHLHVRVDPDVVVNADPSLAVSALDNVLGNAVKYTDVGDVELVAEELPNEVVLHVRDACGGLSADEIRTIFQPFRRGSSPKPGTGLGLAIARRALEAQGGAIHAETEPGKGCHFWLTLPKPPH